MGENSADYAYEALRWKNELDKEEIWINIERLSANKRGIARIAGIQNPRINTNRRSNPYQCIIKSPRLKAHIFWAIPDFTQWWLLRQHPKSFSQ